MFDIPIFGALLFRNYPKYISKRELAQWLPSISFNLRRGGHAIIDRDDRGGRVAAIRELAAQVRERGITAVIFPEGTARGTACSARSSPPGALALLDEAPDVPVVVVAIDESWRLLRFNLLPIPFGTRVRVRIGAPIARRPDEDRARAARATRARRSRDARALARGAAGLTLRRAAGSAAFEMIGAPRCTLCTSISSAPFSRHHDVRSVSPGNATPAKRAA